MSSDAARAFKDAVYKQLARMGKALSSGPRLEILDLLTQGPRTVEAIAGQVGQSVANTSHHLRALARARLVASERVGLYVTYRVANDDVSALFAATRSLAEQQFRELHDATGLMLEERGALDAVGARELQSLLDAGDVTLVDVRPAQEYAVGHIPGAVSLPMSELEERIAELPADRQIVAYCRGPFCVMASDATAVLREHGFRAVHFDRAIADWRALGLPVETGASK